MTDFIQFTKRTNEPKLTHLESLLTERFIEHRRNGESFHAPILEVEALKAEQALEILDADIFGDGRAYDDIPDDDDVFTQLYFDNDDDGCGYDDDTPMGMGWLGSDGLP